MAYNGKDALDLIKEIHPDIVVTDIRMPGYDGITLIEKTREFDSGISFIIVSGYRDFEYAQQALKYGAEDYLLKPVSKDELEQIIEKVIEKKISAKRKVEKELNLQNELIQSRASLRRQLAAKIVDNECKLEPSDTDFFKSPNFQVLIFQIDHLKSSQTIDSVKAIDTILQKIELYVSSYLSDSVSEILCGYRDFSLVFVLNFRESPPPVMGENDDRNEGVSYRDLEHLLESATQKISEYGEWQITLCPGIFVSGFNALNENYVEAEAVRRSRILRGCGKILQSRNFPAVDEELKLFDLTALQEKIKKTVVEADVSDVKELLLKRVVPPEVNQKIRNPETVFELFRFTVNVFIDEVRKVYADKTVLNELLKKTEEVFINAGSLQRLSSHLADIFSSSLKNVISSKRVKDYRPIRIAKEYIDMHYSENIDLNSIAKEAGLNPVYFSSLFKKETGINFKDYLLQKRIDTAKELLLSGNDTIMVVSEKVGYRDVRHFSKIFSRTVGIKPNMYRRIYG